MGQGSQPCRELEDVSAARLGLAVAGSGWVVSPGSVSPLVSRKGRHPPHSK